MADVKKADSTRIAVVLFFHMSDNSSMFKDNSIVSFLISFFNIESCFVKFPVTPKPPDSNFMLSGGSM